MNKLNHFNAEIAIIGEQLFEVGYASKIWFQGRIECSSNSRLDFNLTKAATKHSYYIDMDR